MAKIHGKNAQFQINSVDLEEDGNSITLDVSVDVSEVTSFEDTYKEFVEGVAEFSLSVDLFWNSAASKNDVTLQALIGGGSVTFEFGPEGGTGGNIKYSGSVIMTSYSPAASVSGPVTASATFQGTGALTRGTY